ncbi:MAG: hypothetical protein JW724_06165 [Candidatus Altiarchaeota archaeon]|nr:hypothetical protein [Candidatus Altiarchaeota archaeon]
MTKENVTQAEPTRWEVMARERNARVIRCNTPDTYTLLDLARGADRSVRALRNRLLVSLQPEQVVPLLERYKQLMMDLSDLVEQTHAICGMDYSVPRSILRMKGIDAEGEDEKKGSRGKRDRKSGNGEKGPADDSQ